MSPLQEMRQHHGWTQKDIAGVANVDTRTVKRWEAMDEPPVRALQLYQSIFEGAVDEPIAEKELWQLEDVMDVEPDPLPLSTRFADLLGSLPRAEQFSVLISGASGAGKSTATMMIAGDLARNGTVLLATAEERVRTGTIGLRAKHANIDPDDIDVVEVSTSDELRSLLNEVYYEFVVVDSINELGLTPAMATDMFTEHPQTSFILVAQADATEKRTVGGARWRHIVDVRLWCERTKNGDRIIHNHKNRFGPRVDQLVLSNAIEPTKKRAPADQQEMVWPTVAKQPETDMNNEWIIKRLESELETARKEISDLRSQLSTKAERLRDTERELDRYQIREELKDDEPKRTLADSFDADKIASLADKFAPMLGSLASAILNKSPTAVPPAPHPFVADGPPDFVTGSPTPASNAEPPVHPFGLDITEQPQGDNQ